MNYCYWAGFFDGEGTVTISKSGHGYSLRVWLSQKTTPTNEEVMKEMHNVFGGGISYIKKNDKHCGMIMWHASGKLALSFLKKIKRYAKGKKDQITLAIKYGNKFNRYFDRRNKKGMFNGWTEKEKELQLSYKNILINLRKYEQL